MCILIAIKTILIGPSGMKTGSSRVDHVWKLKSERSRELIELIELAK